MENEQWWVVVSGNTSKVQVAQGETEEEAINSLGLTLDSCAENWGYTLGGPLPTERDAWKRAANP